MLYPELAVPCRGKRIHLNRFNRAESRTLTTPFNVIVKNLSAAFGFNVNTAIGHIPHKTMVAFHLKPTPWTKPLTWILYKVFSAMPYHLSTG
jgi:hypothetical protein